MSAPLPPMDLSDNPTGCCPRFHAEPWDNRDFSLEGLKFIKASTRSFLFVPLDMGKVMGRLQKDVDAAGARPPDRYLILSHDVSPWKADHYYLVSRDVPGYAAHTLPGDFHARVFEGPYGKMGEWYKAMAQDFSASARVLKEVYAFYTTCPKCAKVYGKNYVVLLART